MPAIGAWSTTVEVETAAAVPDKIELTLTGGENKVTLTWDAPKPNGAPISRYQISRWDRDQRMWISVRDYLPASYREYEDTELEAGTLYFYRIRAVNSIGPAAWSTFVSESTEAADE